MIAVLRMFGTPREARKRQAVDWLKNQPGHYAAYMCLASLLIFVILAAILVPLAVILPVAILLLKQATDPNVTVLTSDVITALISVDLIAAGGLAAVFAFEDVKRDRGLARKS